MSNEDHFHLGMKALLRDHEGKLLLLQRSTPSKKSYWDLPGGRTQKGETPLQTLQREIREEIGLQEIKPLSHFSMFVTNIRIAAPNESVGLILSVFLCEPISFTPVLSDEHDHFDWFTPKEVIQKLPQYPAEFLEKLALL